MRLGNYSLMIAWPIATSLVSATGEDVIPLSGLGQLGAVGTVLGVLFTFAWKVYNREVKRADANELEVKRLNEAIQGKFIPAMIDSSQAMREGMSLTVSVKAALDESSRVLAEFADLRRGR